MKKIMPLIVSLGLAAGLSGCGNVSDSKDDKVIISDREIVTIPDGAEPNTEISSTDGNSEDESNDPAVTTAPQPDENEKVYTTSAYSLDENGYYVYDFIDPIPLDDIVLYDRDNIKVVAKEINSNGFSLMPEVPCLNLVCEVTNNTTEKVQMGLRHISINNTSIGWAVVQGVPSAGPGKTETGAFVIPMSNILDLTGFNTSDIEKLNFTVTHMVNGKDMNGEPMEIFLYEDDPQEEIKSSQSEDEVKN